MKTFKSSSRDKLSISFIAYMYIVHCTIAHRAKKNKSNYG